MAGPSRRPWAPSHSPADRGHIDRGDIVTGWLFRVAAVLAVVAVVGIDGITVSMAHVNVTDDANNAAAAGRDDYATNKNVEAAYRVAVANAKAANSADVIPAKSFTIDQNGDVTLTVTRPIHTFVAHYLPMPALHTATAQGSASPATS